MSSNDSHVRPRPWFSAQAGASPAPSQPSSGKKEVGRTVERGAADAPAVECPPHGLAALSDSAARFLLTDLEPALQLARQIRRDMTAAEDPLPPVLAQNRRDEAMKLLRNRAGGLDS